MNAPTLWPFQQNIVDRVRMEFRAGRHRVLIVSPTGSGKTVMFSYIAAEVARRGKRVILVAHRVELVEQIAAALTAQGIEHGIIAPGYPSTSKPVQVASIGSLGRRLDRLSDIDLLVVDEAHHAIAGSWVRIAEAAGRAFILGVTATPERLDGRGLAAAFDVIVEGPTVERLIGAGYLTPALVYAPPAAVDVTKIKVRAGDYALNQLGAVMSEAALLERAVQAYKRRATGIPTVAFCATRAHSRIVVERLSAAGIRAAHVDGETPAEGRRRLIAGLGDGSLDVLSNVNLIGEGVDVPEIGAVLLLRPTQSPALYLQQVGRALRASPGKTAATILDEAGNAYRHGLPDTPRAWSLDAQRRKKLIGRPLVQCSSCSALAAVRRTYCPACDEPLPAEMRTVAGMPYGRALNWAGSDEARLQLVARARGYSRGWVFHRLNETSGERP